MRPAGRSLSSRPRRERFTGDDLAGEYLRGWDQAQEDARTLIERTSGYELGYEAGRADEAREHREREEQLRRLVDAADAAEAGDMTLLDEFLGDAPAGDDFLDVADAAGVTTPDVDGGELAAEIEAWLRGQAGGR
ncbi:hypothetical protein M3G91_28525 [Micromonospora chalcea]|uniref:hypothetical protein n=1 Tax=Micromonospora chalcea TaxID=1874 RepID=UPI0021A283EF|nr:hypothetical protein [Micromonospora chalcea]MCT2281555.1 hypothetical protein [Micromonospora chalcea]